MPWFSKREFSAPDGLIRFSAFPVRPRCAVACPFLLYPADLVINEPLHPALVPPGVVGFALPLGILAVELTGLHRPGMPVNYHQLGASSVATRRRGARQLGVITREALKQVAP